MGSSSALGHVASTPVLPVHMVYPVALLGQPAIQQPKETINTELGSSFLCNQHGKPDKPFCRMGYPVHCLLTTQPLLPGISSTYKTAVIQNVSRKGQMSLLGTKIILNLGQQRDSGPVSTPGPQHLPGLCL